MKIKGIIAAALALAVTAPLLPQTAERAAAAAPASFYLNTSSESGGANFENGYNDGKIAVDINGGSAVLVIKDDVTLYSTDRAGTYGTPIVAVGGKDYTIRIENDAVLDLVASGSGNYIYGLYITGQVTIEGGGTINITSGGGTEESAAVRCYGVDASLTINGARVTAADSGGYGVWDDKNCITLADGAVLEASGGEAAFKNEIPQQRLIVSAGESAAAAADTDKAAQDSKYVKLEAFLDYDADAHAMFWNGETAVTSGMTAYMPSGEPVTGNRDDKNGWFLEPSDYPSSYIRCDIDDDIMNSLDGSRSAVVAVDYYDGDINGGFGLYYDSRTGPKTEFVQLEGTSQWKTKVFRLYDAYFDGGAMTDDFRIVTNSEGMGVSGVHVLIGGVYVSADENDAPFEITALSNELGNIFFEGYNIEFDIEYENVGAQSYSGLTAVYTVKDIYGKGCKTVTHNDLTAEPSFTDKLNLETLPYGVYTLEIYLSGAGVEQRKTVDFSYSRSVDFDMGVNPNLGINVHFDDTIYNETEMRKQARLLWYAGFGFARSSARWEDVETEKGQYSIPNNILHAEEFLDKEKTGIETTAILYTQNDLYDSPPYYLETDEQLNAFSEYCEFVARNLNTDYFCMLNEFNHDSSSYIDNQDEYIRIAEAGYEAIKSVNPDAKINGGSLAGASRYWTNDESGSKIKAELMNWCDSFSWHFYSQTSPPENNYFKRAKTLKEFLKELNGTTEMWITECGWPTRVSNDALDEEKNKEIAHSHDSATELEQARWYTRAAALFSDDAMADKFFFYNLIDAETDHFDIQANFGIVHAKSYRTPFAAKPAYVASAAFNDLTGCTELEEHSYENGVYAYEFKNGTICLWADEGQSADYTFDKHPDSKYIAVFDMYGNPTYYTDDSVKLTVTQEPVYVRTTSVQDAPVLKEYDYDKSYVPYSTTRPTPVPVPEWVGEDGTFWSEDFSGAAVYDWYDENLKALRTENGGKYGNIFEVSITPAKGYGRTLEQNTGVDSGFYLYNKDIGGVAENEDIDMQTLVLAQDVYIPSGEYTGGRAYTETWSTERLEGERTSTGAAHIFEISPGSDSAKLVFQTKPAAIDAIEETGKNTVSLKYDTWHRIETAVNFAAGTVEYYVDGQKAAIYRGTPSDIRLFFPMAYFGLRSDTENAGENPLKLFWDNFNMRVTDEEFVPSQTSAAADEEYDVKNTLINMDFDDVTANQLTSDDLRLVHQTSADDYSFYGDPNETLTYTKLVQNENGGQLIEYEHYLTPYPRNGLKFPFRDPDTGAPVTADSGLLIVEFDAGIKGDTGHSRVLIGLNDPNKTDSDWTPATLLSGIMPYDGEKLSVTAAMPDARNKLTGDSGMESTMAFTKQGELHHYKYVIDIDRGTYKMYYDNILLGEFDRLAGDAKNNSFDALMITGVNAGDSTEGKAYIMIDNIVVKNAARAEDYATETIYLGTFDDDENAETKTGIASGYVTMISDAAAGQTIDSIEWRFKTPNGTIKELAPSADTKNTIMLNGGAAEITVIVDDLTEEAKCLSVVIN